uniref:Uncharacterized protein n=1 Tax=Anopheles minimus TaxID=112268 RepID=A0A182WPM8_9DIPT
NSRIPDKVAAESSLSNSSNYDDVSEFPDLTDQCNKVHGIPVNNHVNAFYQNQITIRLTGTTGIKNNRLPSVGECAIQCVRNTQGDNFLNWTRNRVICTPTQSKT